MHPPAAGLPCASMTAGAEMFKICIRVISCVLLSSPIPAIAAGFGNPTSHGGYHVSFHGAGQRTSDEVKAQFNSNLREEFESVRGSADCGAELGEVAIHHYGQYAFSGTQYTFKVKFDPETSGFSYTYDYGVNYSATFNPMAGQHNFHDQDWTLIASSASSRTSIRSDVNKLKAALARAGDTDPIHAKTIACLQSKFDRVDKAYRGLMDPDKVVKKKQEEVRQKIDCGAKLGEVEIQHYGHGLYSGSKYTFRVKFDASTRGFNYTYDLGINREAHYHPVNYIFQYANTLQYIPEVNDPALEVIDSISADLQILKQRISENETQNPTYNEAISCIEEKLRDLR